MYHLMYADDIVLLAQSVETLQRLINACEKYGLDYDILYNPTKSGVTISIKTQDLKVKTLSFDNLDLKGSHWNTSHWKN